MTKEELDNTQVLTSLADDSVLKIFKDKDSAVSWVEEKKSTFFSLDKINPLSSVIKIQIEDCEDDTIEEFITAVNRGLVN